MNRIVLAALALAALSAGAEARPDYDASIDAAAARIVAGKMGELRGTIDPRAEPKPAPAVDRRTTGSVTAGSGWIGGLTPAVELRFVVPSVR